MFIFSIITFCPYNIIAVIISLLTLLYSTTIHVFSAETKVQDFFSCLFFNFVLDRNYRSKELLAETIPSKDIRIKDKVIESAKLKKMFMPSVDTRGQQQWQVVKGRGIPGPGQLLTPHSSNAPPAPPHSKCPHAQQQQGTKGSKLSNLSTDAPSSVP